MSARRCPARYCPHLIPAGARYCPDHLAEYEQRRGTPTQRGYDTKHKAARARWQARINAGETVMCARDCGRRITTDTPWDLGHNDDRTQHTGPECLPCNRGAGGREGRARQTT